MRYSLLHMLKILFWAGWFIIYIYIFFSNLFSFKVPQFLINSFHSSFRGFSTPQYNMYLSTHTGHWSFWDPLLHPSIAEPILSKTTHLFFLIAAVNIFSSSRNLFHSRMTVKWRHFRQSFNTIYLLITLCLQMIFRRFAVIPCIS